MKPSQRPTPLTDAAKRPITANWNNEGDERRDVVFADHARTLERSLAERTEERDALKKSLPTIDEVLASERLAAVTSERDALHKEVELVIGFQDREADATRKALTQLAVVTAERDALKQSLARHACGNPHCICTKCCREVDAELSALPRLGGDQ